eukprot:2413140-Pyramimonas_sp.AAC.1
MGFFSSSKKKGTPEEQAYNAAANGDLKEIQKVIKKGLNANNVVQRVSQRFEIRTQNSVPTSLESDVYVYVRTLPFEKGWTMLHVAADRGDAALVRAVFQLKTTYPINASPRDKVRSRRHPARTVRPMAHVTKSERYISRAGCRF